MLGIVEAFTHRLSVTRIVTRDTFLACLSKVILCDRIKPIAVINPFDIYTCNQV
jgi:hypothetical protein